MRREVCPGSSGAVLSPERRERIEQRKERLRIENRPAKARQGAPSQIACHAFGDRLTLADDLHRLVGLSSSRCFPAARADRRVGGSQRLPS